jgi:hypothetical protein
MSKREDFTNDLADKIGDLRDWTAPYGILTGLSDDHRSRTITFGVARTLDATVQVFSPSFITLRTSSGIHTKFASENELLKFLKDNYV